MSESGVEWIDSLARQAQTRLSTPPGDLDAVATGQRFLFERVEKHLQIGL